MLIEIESRLREFIVRKIFQGWRNSDAVATMTCATLLVSFTFNVFIFCYVGELLSEQVVAKEFHLFKHCPFYEVLSMIVISVDKSVQIPTTSNGTTCHLRTLTILFY